MRNITCDICAEPIWREEDANDSLLNFAITQELNIRLNEVCKECIADIRVIFIKYVGSKVETRKKNWTKAFKEE